MTSELFLAAEQRLGWHLYNALSSEAGAHLVRPIGRIFASNGLLRACAKELGGENRKALRPVPAHLPPPTIDTDDTNIRRKGILQRVLSAFACRPPESTEAFERNARFAAEEFLLTEV